MPPCRQGQLCGRLPSPLLLPRGGWRASPPAVGWGRVAPGAGCDLVGSGVWGRRGAAVSAFWVPLGWAPATWEGVRVSVRGGEQFAWAAFGRPGGWVWRFRAVCGGRVWVTGQVGVPWGVRVFVEGVRGLPGVGGGEAPLAGGSVVGVCGCSGRGGACRGARGCARWWACVGHWVASGGEGHGVGLGSRAVCRCTCPVAAVR